MGFKKLLRDYLEYYPSEKKGVFYLSLIIVLWTVGLYVYSRMPQSAEHDAEFEQAVSEYYADLERKQREASVAPVKEKFTETESRNWNLFAFDPNKLSGDSLQLLGLPRHVVKAIENYRGSGGQFRKPDDLARIYTLREDDFLKVKPYIQISESEESTSQYDKSWKQEYVDYESDSTGDYTYESDIVLELNTADTAELQQIYGIGSYFAREIVKLREAFGGYRSFNQLLEIYNLDSAQLDEIAPYFTLDTSLVERIDINRVTLDELRRHPYFPYTLANSIVKMREAHGPYRKIEDIKRSYLVNDSIFNRVKPYLKIHE